MSRLQRAYEALIDDLEAEIAKSTKTSISDNKVILDLLRFILKHHGRKKTLELAEKLEREGGICLVEAVEEECHMTGLDLVEPD